MPLLLFLVGLGALALSHTAPFPLLIDELAGDRAVWKMPRAGAAGPRTGTGTGTRTGTGTGTDDGGRVYLTFDDGPNPAATPALLDVLERERVRATFFLIEKHVTPDTAPIVTRMAADGHDVALHSHTRALMFLTAEALAARLTASADHIERLSGTRPCAAFRPHAGFRSQSMYDGLARIDHVLVGWGWNLWDWNWFRRRQARTIVPRLAAHVSDGDIVVIHDGHHKNPRADRRYAVETVAQLIPALRARGFAFGAICTDLREARGLPNSSGFRRDRPRKARAHFPAGDTRPRLGAFPCDSTRRRAR